MKIAEAIRRLRDAFDDTQAAFAKRTNLSAASVAHFENGSRKPDPGSLVFLARTACKGGLEDLAEVFVANLPGVREELLIPVWRANLRQPPSAPISDRSKRAPDHGSHARSQARAIQRPGLRPQT